MVIGIVLLVNFCAGRSCVVRWYIFLSKLRVVLEVSSQDLDLTEVCMVKHTIFGGRRGLFSV